METYTVKSAQGALNRLLLDAHMGKTILIEAENGRAVKLVPASIKPVKSRKPGSARGKIWMAEDFDDPLDDFDEYME